MELQIQYQTEITKFYKWDFVPDIVIENNRINFRNETDAQNEQELTQLLLVLVIYGTLKNSTPGNSEYYYVNKLCNLWKIDLVKLSYQIEEEFNVKIDVLKTLFND